LAIVVGETIRSTRSASEETPMFPINDAFDAILVGTFLFGLLFTVGSFLLGVADLGADVDSDHGLDNLFNLSSILAFITWFGGVGYLARAGFGWPWPVAIVVALAGGLFAAWLAFQFVRRILKSPDQFLNPSDFERVGVLARVSSGIRAGGVGEIVWEQGGSRRVTSARAANDEPIARGTEVLVLKVERGIAIVEPFELDFESLSGERS
jgi:membrane protein implicated in regulation of membrane protease activity